MALHQATLADDKPIDPELELRVLRGTPSFAVFHGARSRPDECVCDVCGENQIEEVFAYHFGLQACEQCHVQYDEALMNWRKRFIIWYRAQLERQEDKLADNQTELADLPA